MEAWGKKWRRSAYLRRKQDRGVDDSMISRRWLSRWGLRSWLHETTKVCGRFFISRSLQCLPFPRARWPNCPSLTGILYCPCRSLWIVVSTQHIKITSPDFIKVEKKRNEMNWDNDIKPLSFFHLDLDTHLYIPTHKASRFEKKMKSWTGSRNCTSQTNRELVFFGQGIGSWFELTLVFVNCSTPST